MHLLLAIGAGLLMFVLSIADSCHNIYIRNHVPSELEEMKNMSTMTVYGDHWMVNCLDGFNKKIPVEIRRKSWEEAMTETWGPNYEERNANWKFDPDKTIAIPRRNVWNDYWRSRYGEKFDKKYPYLKFPSESYYK